MEFRNVRCGPTVYAPSHMGHARTYLGFDIIRKILENYFNYEVDLVMNITDLDDKIIDRANETGITHTELSTKFEQEFHEDMRALGVAPPTVLTRVTDYMDEIVEYISAMVQKGVAYESNGSVYFSVNDFTSDKFNGVYGKLEPENVGDEAKLAEGEGNRFTQATHGTSDKRNPRDFALWKATKDYETEPSWDSPWGGGRPGWHIECSVMASTIFRDFMGVEGGKMDIHSGGIDLKFPHHDNELAQSESCNECDQWVNYFVHSGHLHIKGFKMSKSLKNFISIRQALEQNTARQVRLCFLMHKYNAPMDYGDNTMQHAIVLEKTFVEFFHNVKAALRACASAKNKHQKWSKQSNKEKAMYDALNASRKAVGDALRDDFDTPAALQALSELVKSTNLYLNASSSHVSYLLQSVASFVTEIFRVFGLCRTVAPAIGFDNSTSSLSLNNENSQDDGVGEEGLAALLDAVVNFRSNVRAAKDANKENTSDKDRMNIVLSECDKFRDDILPELGIRLEDKPDGSIWKLCDPEELRRERELKEQEAARKLAEKEAIKEQARLKELMNRMPPIEFMKQLTLDDNDNGSISKKKKYDSESFDESTGLPTKLSNGEELNKNQKKKAMKEYSGQKKKYEKYLKSLEN